jgi:tetratricopeptide (TPR) repeat protein
MRLAAVAYAADRVTDAHAALDRVLVDEPANEAALLLKASWLHREGQTQEAMERARTLVAADPRSAPAHYLLGTIQSQARDLDGATKSFNEVLRLNPRATDAQVQLSRLTLARGDTASAIWLAQEAGKNAPGSPEPRLMLARAFIAQGQTARAESELSALLKQFPDTSGVHALNAALKVVKKDFSGARLEYERALKLEPGSIDALTGLAMLEISQNKVLAAGARMEEFLSTSSDRSEVLALAARVFVAAKDFVKAETLLRRLIEVDRDNMAGYSLLGQVYLIQQKLDPAKAEFDNRARLNPKDATARLMVAMILEAQQNIGEAKKKYEEVLAIDSRSVIAANNLAYLYAESGQDLDRALSLAQTAAEHARDNAAVQDTLGWVYYHKAVPDLAILAFEKSTAKEPANPVYRYHLGLAYAKRGDLGRARLSFEAALKIKPDYAEAQQALKSIRG